jgi:hypothetical protein
VGEGGREAGKKGERKEGRKERRKEGNKRNPEPKHEVVTRDKRTNQKAHFR